MIEPEAIRPSRRQALDELLRPGFRAFRHNWAPFLALQSIAAALVIGFYRAPTVRDVFEHVNAVRVAWGEVYVILSGIVSGSVLPQAARILTGRVQPRGREFWTNTAYYALVFAIVAMQVDGFYRVQTALFGQGIDPATLAKKTVLDMFVVTPFIFNPSAMWMLRAGQVGFKRDRMRGMVSWEFYREWVLPTLPIGWCYWIPMLVCIYSLPSSIQFPFSQVTEACWVLLFVFMSKEFEPASAMP